jgi:hypothetical protein
MFLRANQRSKDGKEHTYWSLVETVRTAHGPRQKTLCYLGELNGSAQARWSKTIEVFNEQGETEQLKLFPSQVEAPAEDPQVARVLVNRVRLERLRQFGPAGWVWNCGDAWNWICFSRPAWMTRRRMCPGRGWWRCDQSPVCAGQ